MTERVCMVRALMVRVVTFLDAPHHSFRMMSPCNDTNINTMLNHNARPQEGTLASRVWAMPRLTSEHNYQVVY